MKLFSIILFFLGSTFFLVNVAEPSVDFKVNKKATVAEILDKLGDEGSKHEANIAPKVSAETGRRIVLEGFSNGNSTKQSKHFVCTSCHNVERDEPDLSVVDPQTRLEYTAKKGLPFLQGTSLYGAVDRTSFYNGDYEKKYGDLVVPARDNLREAIQLCAVECSQGRILKTWELESVLAYLWTIGLKLEDLNLAESDYKKIESAINTGGDQAEIIAFIKSKYLSGAPATFVYPPKDRKKGFEGTVAGNPENGKLVYEQSCQHCHENERYSYFNLDNSETTFKYLDKHFNQYTRYSTYQVARYGTSPLPGKRAYMPHYTKEKMSDQMIEDLKAYIVQQAL